ncbi:MAG: tRNA (adenosine(37)-N6)-dimethylallyltransferase MiaA [Candidatus Omnitrophota bacterium]|nr:tRNA (adenosine(37)-N6)-dimethylallyltransferase MiaA [Candidatus Omnitrophota bacterium]
MKERLVFLVGPTAIGKTGISIELAGLINGEVISCDSMQVYKGMDIGTSKPAEGLITRIPHHMIDIIEPSDEFSVAQFRRMAVKAIEDIIARGKTPLVVGGSGLYVKVLIDGIFEAPSTDREFRARLKQEADEFGTGILYIRLQEVDKEAASGIHPNDLRRILRALEVYEKAKAPISQLRTNTVGLSDKYEVRIFGLNMERPALYKKIEERVDLMFKEGLVDEAKRLTEKKLSLTASQALGYKEVFAFLRGEYDIEEAKRLIKRNTRHYAKRQFTWFRRDKRIEWMMLDENFDSKEIAKEIWKKLS